MEALLDQADKSDIRAAPTDYDTTNFDVVLSNILRTQDRLDKIWVRVAQKRDAIIEQKTARNNEFLLLYAVGTFIVIGGTVGTTLLSTQK
jgi:hypothetical protein